MSIIFYRSILIVLIIIFCLNPKNEDSSHLIKQLITGIKII